MFWKVLLVFALYIVTVLWGSVGIIIPLIVVRFANPLIKHLGKLGMIDEKAARKRTRFTVLLWLVMDIVAVVVLILIGNRFVWIGAALGCISTLLFGFRKTGRNMANKDDFVKSYGIYITGDPEAVCAEIARF